ncbi:MAG: L-fuconolactonase [Candidatus Poriferisodalaceae bacterium]|jgi:L-fuconolactonase
MGPKNNTGGTPMLTIDSQVHAYERDHPGRPWHGVLHGPAEVTGDDMVAAMDAVDVDGAVLVSPFMMYRYDASYALDVYKSHPTRFGLIKPVDPSDPAVEDTIHDWAATNGTVAIRLMLHPAMAAGTSDAQIDRVMATAADHALPVNVLAWGTLDQLDQIAARNPNTQLVLDHIGLPQPFEPPVPDEPFADLDNVLDLSRHDNLAIKISGACTLSNEPDTLTDIWEPLTRIFDAYGFERCMWGTDWTRAVELVTYEQGVQPFRLTDRLSDSDRAVLMGGALSKIYNWAPTKA